MNVYSELLQLLSPRRDTEPAGLVGVISGVSPLRVRVGETEVSQGLYLPLGRTFTVQDVGREAALLPVGDGFVILTEVTRI